MAIHEMLTRIYTKLDDISDKLPSGGSSSLPEVTAEDNGDVLTVVEGAWNKADAIEPSKINFLDTQNVDGEMMTVLSVGDIYNTFVPFEEHTYDDYATKSFLCVINNRRDHALGLVTLFVYYYFSTELYDVESDLCVSGFNYEQEGDDKYIVFVCMGFDESDLTPTHLIVYRRDKYKALVTPDNT